MAAKPRAAGDAGKKIAATTRDMTTALFLLRAAQLGISIQDLDLLTVGMVFDMMTEKINDTEGEYARVATQEDIDNWFGR